MHALCPSTVSRGPQNLYGVTGHHPCPGAEVGKLSWSIGVLPATALTPVVAQGGLGAAYKGLGPLVVFGSRQTQGLPLLETGGWGWALLLLWLFWGPGLMLGTSSGISHRFFLRPLAGALGSREEPEFVTARAGESVILGCDVIHPLTGQPPPYVVEWFKFGVPIPIFIKFGFYPPHVDPEYAGESWGRRGTRGGRQAPGCGTARDAQLRSIRSSVGNHAGSASRCSLSTQLVLIKQQR